MTEKTKRDASTQEDSVTCIACGRSIDLRVSEAVVNPERKHTYYCLSCASKKFPKEKSSKFPKQM